MNDPFCDIDYQEYASRCVLGILKMQKFSKLWVFSVLLIDNPLISCGEYWHRPSCFQPFPNNNVSGVSFPNPQEVKSNI